MSKLCKPVLYVSFVFVASEASIKRPISDWKSAVEKLLVSALALLPLPVLVPLLSWNRISNGVDTTFYMHCFELHIINIVCRTKGRPNSITRLDFDDFLFKILTRALLFIWKSKHLLHRSLSNKKIDSTMGTNSKKVMSAMISGYCQLRCQGIVSTTA